MLQEPKPKKQSAPTAKIGSNKKTVSKPVSSSDESEFESESSDDSDSSDEEVSQSVNLLALGYSLSNFTLILSLFSSILYMIHVVLHFSKYSSM